MTTTDTSTALLSVRDLRVAYGGIQALKGVSLHLNAGELVCLIGANGAGKTTTLKAICGLLKPTSGQVVYQGQVITGQGPWTLPEHGLVMVPEGRGIFARMSIDENLRMGAYLRRDREVEPEELATTDQIGHRFARCTPFEQRIERDDCRFRQLLAAARDQPGTVAAQRVRGQHLRIAPVDAGTGAAQPVIQRHRKPLPGTTRQERLHAPSSASCASCSAWCSCASASSSSVRSPSMMASILYSVRLMRWSVMRPCGKL